MKQALIGFGLFCCGLLWAGEAFAQDPVIPVDYRITRTAPGQATLTTEFLANSVPCNLAVAAPSGVGIRFTDPERPGRDCEYLSAAPFSNRVRGVTYTWTLAGRQNTVDGYGPESIAVDVREPAIPTAPRDFRVTPPADAGASLVVNGTIQDRYPFAGVDVASVWLDIGAWLYVGAAQLSAPGYTVQRGDAVSLGLWRVP